MSSATPIGTSGPTSARTRRTISPSASGILLGDGRAVLRHQDAVPRALLLQQRQHLADDAVEGVLRDRADRAGRGEDQRHDLEAEALAGREVAGQRGGGRGVLLPQLVAAQDSPTSPDRPGTLENVFVS